MTFQFKLSFLPSCPSALFYPNHESNFNYRSISTNCPNPAGAAAPGWSTARYDTNFHDASGRCHPVCRSVYRNTGRWKHLSRSELSFWNGETGTRLRPAEFQQRVYFGWTDTGFQPCTRERHRRRTKIWQHSGLSIRRRCGSF